MNYRLVEARYVSRYLVWVRFSDGVEGEIDLVSELEGPVFEPLKDPSRHMEIRRSDIYKANR